LIHADALAQKKALDTANKVPIHIVRMRVLSHVQTDTSSVDKLLDSVVLQQGNDMMYCDSAYFYSEKNSLEAFGDVKIVQPGGTEAESDYLKYTGNTKEAYMKGNVSLTDGKNKLWTEELTYNVGTKVGIYTQGGTLQSDSTTVSSNEGNYNVNTKDVRFTGDVFVTDPSYNVRSEDMLYNTETKLVTFYPPEVSVVTSDKSVFHTTGGTYDSKNEIAHFVNRSSALNEDQYLEADTLNYNKLTGYGNASGNVISIDTTQHTTLYCGHSEYFAKGKILWATIKPVLKQVNEKDSIFIRADTFFSAPVPQKGDINPKEDSIKVVKSVTGKRKGKKGKTIIASKQEESIASDTSSSADSSRPRYFIGYHHVLIFSDSLQGKCDSISYNQKDSVMKMMYDPIAWSRNSQITGDTIRLHMDSGKLKKLYVPNNAFVVSQSGPAKAQLFDQVQGKTLTANFVDNEIDNMLVKPNAESIYYSKDDDSAYVGVEQAQGEKMIVLFSGQAISKIKYDQDVKVIMTPLEQADLPTMRLSRFRWLIDKRPKSREELFQ